MKLNKLLIIPTILLSLSIILILINAVPYALQDYLPRNAIITIGNHAWVFAHGRYEFKDGYYQHITKLNGKDYSTLKLIQDIQYYGYEHIWLLQCRTGDYDEIYHNNFTNASILWEDMNVTRNLHKGTTHPIFIGYKMTYWESR